MYSEFITLFVSLRNAITYTKLMSLLNTSLENKSIRNQRVARRSTNTGALMTTPFTDCGCDTLTYLHIVMGRVIRGINAFRCECVFGDGIRERALILSGWSS